MKFESHSGKRPRTAARRRVIEEFERAGRTSHSLDGLTLAPLLDYLQNEGVAYTLYFYPGGGYYLERGNKFYPLQPTK